MPNLTIKNIPDNVLRKVKRKAKLNRRSLNSEVIKNLEGLVTSAKINTNLLIEKAKELRAELNITIDDKFLAEHKNAGRL